MAKKLYVGNLSYNVSDDDLRELFTPFGEVQSATVIMDNMTGRSKGFGFVEMASDEGAAKAIADLNGKTYQERALTVNEARPRPEGGKGSRGFDRGGGKKPDRWR